MSEFDVLIVGAGSIGTPAALFLAEAGLSVGVLDPNPSAGRGENRAAIGGIRATHSEPAKVALATESIEVFRTWAAERGDDIGWRQGGYSFVAYDEPTERLLRDLSARLRDHDLEIDFVGPERIEELVPGIEAEGLHGGTYSPGDGSASPLQAVGAFRRHAEAAGARFHFGVAVEGIEVADGRVTGVRTTVGRHEAPVVIDAAGAAARDVAAMVGLELPVATDSHEAGISEPVARFLEPMVVDLRAGPGSKNFYFYQNAEGQLVFCLTPDPPQVGSDRRATSEFLPIAARRMVGLLPRLAGLRIRRTWRGLYPNSPDGSPFLGAVEGVEGFLVAAGMCGQGFMFGPGVGRLLARLLTGRATAADGRVLEELAVGRRGGPVEALR